MNVNANLNISDFLKITGKIKKFIRRELKWKIEQI